MTKPSDMLVGKTVTLVCFGEYVGFIHMDDKDHCRFESETVVLDGNGNRRILFPAPKSGVLPLILGAKVKEITISSKFRMIFENGNVIESEIMPGYESVIVNVSKDSEIF